MPFAPRLERSSSGGPMALHPDGTGVVFALMTCMGSELPFSPPMEISAVLTGPHTTLSTNCAHSKTEFPVASFCCGSDPPTVESADESMRNPNEPVSTSTPETVWQFEEPGAQTVTAVNKPLA